MHEAEYSLTLSGLAMTAVEHFPLFW
jgi:hypothetical protein